VQYLKLSNAGKKLAKSSINKNHHNLAQLHCLVAQRPVMCIPVTMLENQIKLNKLFRIKMLIGQLPKQNNRQILNQQE
jgi:hypothetical protein